MPTSQSFLAYLHKSLLPPDIKDEDELRKAGLMFGITITGIIFLILLGTLAVIQGDQILATVDFLVALILISILLFLRFKGNLSLY